MGLIMGGPPPLPPLRQELRLSKGARDVNGNPTWTLHDPVSGKFFLLGLKEFEILSRWDLAAVDRIADCVTEETVFAASAQDVLELARFLRQHSLVQPMGQEGLEHLMKMGRARKKGVSSVLRSYMFFRIPLMRPDRMLERVLPHLSFVYTRGFLLGVSLLTLLSFFLIVSQWRAFTTTFLYFFSASGIVAYGLALAFSKIIHEMAHALTAKQYGMRVPTLGIAFMVFMPLLYTDASDAWRLPDRRKRMAVTGAGILAEIFLASATGVAWALLDSGPLKSACFLLTSTNWIMSILFNMNPLMRFDGYYLLSDGLRMENLQSRSFALARWKLGSLFFGFDDPIPEPIRRSWRWPLIFYAFACWVYRLSIITGISLMVYTMFFKALGIFLFVMQLWGSLGKLAIMGGRKLWDRRHEMKATWIMAVALSGLMLLFLPIRSSLTSQAVLGPETRVQVHAPRAGRIVACLAGEGRVDEGQPLYTLQSPELESELALSRIAGQRIRFEISVLGFDPDKQEERLVRLAEQDQVESRLASLEEDLSRLSVPAPLSGYMELPDQPFRQGDWIGEGELLSTIMDNDSQIIRTYVRELDVARIQVGGEGLFYPELVELGPIRARIVSIDEHAAREIRELMFSSLHGGGVAVRKAANGRLAPDQAVYRVTLKPVEPLESGTGMELQLRGDLVLDAEGQSFMGRVLRKARSILIRESVF